MTERIVETKECKGCGTSFTITDKDMEFYDKISPIFAGKKYQISSPTLCPDCRQQRRYMFRNFFNLYRRKCDATGKEILATQSPSFLSPVYEMHEWRGENRQALDYGFDADVSQDVFEQLARLHTSVPRMNIVNENSENTGYCNMCAHSKNCYLVFGCVGNEDCYYGHIVWKSKNCYDCLYTYNSQFCYQCVDCLGGYNVFSSINVEDCSDSKFLIDCVGCKSCFGCAGIFNKQYCIYNEQYTKEEYQEKVKAWENLSGKDIKNIRDKLGILKNNEIVKNFHGFDCEDITGDYLYHSKNVFSSYDIKNGENLKYCATLDNFTNCMDCNYSAIKCDLGYNCISAYGYAMICCHNCLGNNSYLSYCDNCYGCNNCFACVGLKSKEYCIFNKQYTKSEYEELVPQFIEKMRNIGKRGEFFPSSFSPFGYNETIAQEYFPLTKEEAIKKGFKRSDYETLSPRVVKILQADELPTIQNATDDILQQAIACEVTGKLFRIIKPELEFYRKTNLPLPRKHPDQRHKERMGLRNPRKLRDRQCGKCGVEIKTTYAPERTEMVYCESCYTKEIYG